MVSSGETYLITIFGEIFKCWEALDLHTFYFIGSRVHLSNYNIFTVLEFLSKLIPDGSKLLAVSTPWGIYGKTKT